jgi:hypothetical protein
MDYKEILKQSIDLHVHVGPEIIPRKFTLPELLEYEKGNLKGIGIKNHFFPTVAMNSIVGTNNAPFVINSIVLNRYVGGFNPDAIRATAALSENPIIVWFPTLHTEKFLNSQKFEIPEEWIESKMRKKIKLRPTKDIKPLFIFDKGGEISQEVETVLQTIKECNAILATGHLQWEEVQALVKVAVEKIGIKKIILTHPIYQKIDMPIEVQKELVELGAVVEHCYSMYSIDDIPIQKIVQQIREVGAKNCIISSDVGQIFSKSPSEALADFMFLLEKAGITERETTMMMVDNPAKLCKK